ncbi:MAG: RNA methyltransferase [Solobacterium sp.]|jgi:TrmH family RNA methyltransferase|nr:RNA methyltransferase [Solobacterium sp.]
MEKIESLQNARIKEWAALHEKKERDRSGKFLVEGEHLIEEAISAGIAECVISDLEETPFPDIRNLFVTDKIMKKLSANVSKAHLIAVCRKPEPSITSYHRLLLLDGIQDPGNLGTLIRTAVSFSFDGICCSEETCDFYNEKTIRSTQGALFHIPLIRTDLNELVPELQKQGVKVIATALDASIPFSSLEKSEQMAFILGNEGQGVSKNLQQTADERIRIEMHGFESLNVAVAGGIVMYRFRAQ